MGAQPRRIFTVSFVLLLSMFPSGCATYRTTLDKGTVSVEILPSTKEYISRAHAYREGNEMIVAGSVRTNRLPIFANGGHVDMVVIAPDGTLIDQRSISHSHFQRRGNPEPVFETRIPLIPQPGTTVRLAYHHPPKPVASNSLDCGQNAAAKHGG